MVPPVAPASTGAAEPTDGVDGADTAEAAAGILIFWPILSFFGSNPGFASMMDLTETLRFLWMLSSVSFFTIVYSCISGTGGGGVAIGCGVAMGCGVFTIGLILDSAGVGFESGAMVVLLVFVSGCELASCCVFDSESLPVPAPLSVD